MGFQRAQPVPILQVALAGRWSSQSSRPAAWARTGCERIRDCSGVRERLPPAFKTVSRSSKPI
jgi:hypothetical protein